jgi:methylenetetrahydrofolate dehydrogenase (NADP+) / methenyltetrahydrofolate cyclohydrolase
MPNAPVAQTRLLYGKPLAEHLLAQVRQHAHALTQPATLALVLVEGNAASAVYVARKQKACKAVGIACEVITLSNHITKTHLHKTLHSLAQNAAITAIVLQLPLPNGFDVQAALDIIPVHKDADGLTTINQTKRIIWPATPLGVMRLLASQNIPVKNQTVCVIGRSNLVGKPLTQLLAQAGAKVISITKDTPNPHTLCTQASLVCVAAGVPNLLTSRWLATNAGVIDIGLTRTPEGLKGDACITGPYSVLNVANAITPVPGGVGPLTVASLLTNVIDCAYMQTGKQPVSWQV